MTPKEEERILDEAKKRYKIASEAWGHIYDELKSDLRFTYDVDGGQWSEAIKNERGDRPTITVNKLQKFVRQIRGDMLQNRPRVNVIPVDSVADPKKAELFNGIIREIEYLSSADIAYDTAYNYAVSGSVGYWRILTEYAEGDTFDQDIKIKRIINPTSVHFDPEATEFCLEDAKYCFIETLMSKERFEEKYKDVDVRDFSGTDDLYGSWIEGDSVRLAEYYVKEPVTRKVAQLIDGSVVEVKAPFNEKSPDVVRVREVEDYKIMWYLLCGVKVLKSVQWVGKYIPVIPVFGDEIIAGGKKFYLSMIRGAKGAQQMYNYWASAATENVMMSPKSPYVVDHRQVKGFETEWNEANKKNRMFIRYNAIAGMQKPSREPQTQVPSAIIGMLQSTAFDVEDHLGRYESSKGEASNERSGKAIVARIKQSDKGTYTFVDNLTRAIIYSGRQLVDLIPKIYDTKRALRIRGEDGQEQVVNVNEPVLDQNQNVVLANDLSVGKFDLIAAAGASYGSQRQEMVQMMIEAMQYAPQLAPVIAPLVFKYSDWPGASEVATALQQYAQQQPVEEQ